MRHRSRKAFPWRTDRIGQFLAAKRQYRPACCGTRVRVRVRARDGQCVAHERGIKHCSRGPCERWYVGGNAKCLLESCQLFQVLVSWESGIQQISQTFGLDSFGKTLCHTERRYRTGAALLGTSGNSTCFGDSQSLQSRRLNCFEA